MASVVLLRLIMVLVAEELAAIGAEYVPKLHKVLARLPFVLIKFPNYSILKFDKLNVFIGT